MIEYWIDIPNLKTVDLPNSFRYVESKSITSICMNNIEWIDVSPILADIIPITYSCDYIESIESNVTSIHLPDLTCNDLNYTIFNFSRFTTLIELIIGSDSFENVNLFVIDGLNELRLLTIGNNSFSSYEEQGIFHILNCSKLESIEIGEYSFCYYDLFELRNLPNLKFIELGDYVLHFSSSSILLSSIWVIWMDWS